MSATKATKETAKQEVQTTEVEQLIYLGPTLPSRLNQYALFRGGVPAHLRETIAGIPELSTLFVPVKEFAQRQLDLRKVGTPLQAAYAAVLSKLKEGK